MRSQSSKKEYRIRSKKQDLDESLFGRRKSSTPVNREEEMKKLTEEIRRGRIESPNAILISRTELDRMRKHASLNSKQEEMEQKRIADEQAEKMLAASRAKKQRMLEIEAAKSKIVPPTEAELLERDLNQSMQARARSLVNEQRDEVKQMNHHILEAKVVAIRDMQLMEKKQIREERKVQEKRKDLILEVERLKKVKYYEEEEMKKKAENVKGGSVVIDQIKEREIEKLKQAEEKEKEAREVLKQIQLLQEDEKRKNLLRKERQREMNAALNEANQQAISLKEQKKLQEKAEEEKIYQYNLDKLKAEAEKLAENQRMRAEKEKELQRLRDKQEKASDRQAEFDALRAKRAIEMADRQAREREKREAEKRAKRNEEMFEARKIQAIEKEYKLQDQAKVDRDEFERIISTQKIELDNEKILAQQKQEKIKEYTVELKKQIALQEEKKNIEKRVHLEEGKKLQDRLKAEKIAIEQIKHEKVNELKQTGIPEKYQKEFMKKKIVLL